MKDIDIIIGKYLTRDCSEEELSFLKEWRKDPENETSFQQIMQSWKGNENKANQTRKKDNWNAIMDGIEAIDDTIVIESKTKKLYWPLSIAASIVVFIGITFTLWNNELEKETIAQVFTTKEIKQDHVLPDGTIVTLDRFSTLHMHEFTGSLRLVELRGRAFFKVQKDKNRPFVVRTAHSFTKVLGTQFSVTEKEKGAVSVAVKEGKVALSSESEAGEDLGKVILVANDIGNVIPEKKVSKSTMNSDRNIFSWQTGVLSFDNSSLSKVSTDLNRHYNRNFIFKGVDQSENLTGNFKQKTLEEIVELIAAATNTEAEIKNKNVIFTGDY